MWPGWWETMSRGGWEGGIRSPTAEEKTWGTCGDKDPCESQSQKRNPAAVRLPLLAGCLKRNAMLFFQADTGTFPGPQR